MTFHQKQAIPPLVSYLNNGILMNCHAFVFNHIRWTRNENIIQNIRRFRPVRRHDGLRRPPHRLVHSGLAGQSIRKGQPSHAHQFFRPSGHTKPRARTRHAPSAYISGGRHRHTGLAAKSHARTSPGGRRQLRHHLGGKDHPYDSRTARNADARRPFPRRQHRLPHHGHSPFTGRPA